MPSIDITGINEENAKCVFDSLAKKLGYTHTRLSGYNTIIKDRVVVLCSSSNAFNDVIMIGVPKHDPNDYEDLSANPIFGKSWKQALKRLINNISEVSNGFYGDAKVSLPQLKANMPITYEELMIALDLN